MTKPGELIPNVQQCMPAALRRALPLPEPIEWYSVYDAPTHQYMVNIRWGVFDRATWTRHPMHEGSQLDDVMFWRCAQLEAAHHFEVMRCSKPVGL